MLDAPFVGARILNAARVGHASDGEYWACACACYVAVRFVASLDFTPLILSMPLLVLLVFVFDALCLKRVALKPARTVGRRGPKEFAWGGNHRWEMRSMT